MTIDPADYATNAAPFDWELIDDLGLDGGAILNQRNVTLAGYPASCVIVGGLALDGAAVRATLVGSNALRAIVPYGSVLPPSLTLVADRTVEGIETWAADMALYLPAVLSKWASGRTLAEIAEDMHITWRCHQLAKAHELHERGMTKAELAPFMSWLADDYGDRLNCGAVSDERRRLASERTIPVLMGIVERSHSPTHETLH